MGIRGALSKNGERLIAYRVGCSPRNLHNLHNLHRVGFGTVRDSFTLIADSDIKALTEALPGESFETTAFTTPPPLADATVAIVTSASLHHPDQDDFEVMDTGYRVLDGSRRDYVTGHWSPNFDGSGFAYDMNTVFPVDRLDELAERGVIGRVADQHLAYAGNQFDLSAIRMDSGPAGAKFLRDQGVDVVLLTPV